LLLLYIATGKESNDFFLLVLIYKGFLFIYGKELKNDGFKKYVFKGKFIEVILNLVNQENRFI
jgi:hypothetical protein